MRSARGNQREVLDRKDEFTNKELREFLERLDLEKKLSEASVPAKKTGFKAAGRVLSTVGNKIVIPIVVGTSAYLIQEQLSKRMSAMDAFKDEQGKVDKHKINTATSTILKGVNNWKK